MISCRCALMLFNYVAAENCFFKSILGYYDSQQTYIQILYAFSFSYSRTYHSAKFALTPLSPATAPETNCAPFHTPFSISILVYPPAAVFSSYPTSISQCFLCAPHFFFSPSSPVSLSSPTHSSASGPISYIRSTYSLQPRFPLLAV